MKGLRERLATAASSAQLGEEETDVVAGFALAQGLDPGKVLAGHLWRLRAGDMRSLKPAALLLSKQISGRARRRRWQGGPDVWARMVERVLLEWLADRCAPCGGSGYVSASGEARTFLRGERLRLCPECGGSRRAKVVTVERAAVVSVPHEVYLKHWHGRFEWLLERVRSVDGSISRPMAEQLEDVPA